MPDIPPTSAALTPYSALVKILDIHYQAVSQRYPEGECAVCVHFDSHQQAVVGDRYPCATRQVAESAIDPEIVTNGA